MSEVVNRPATVGTTPKVEDFVCGMSVPADAPLCVEHAGKPYVLWAESYRQRLEADPSAFVGRNAPLTGSSRLKTR